MKHDHGLSTMIDMYSIDTRIYRPFRIPSLLQLRLSPNFTNFLKKKKIPVLRSSISQLRLSQMCDERTRGRNQKNVKVSAHESH